MKYKMSILFSLICLLSIRVYANDGMQWKKIDRKELSVELESLNRMFINLKHVEVTMTYASYENYNTEQFHEKSKGYYMRNENEFHTYILGIHTIQDKDCRLVVDSTKKLIIVADTTGSVNDVMDAAVYATLLKGCNSIFTAQADGYTYYRMEFSAGHTLSSYEFSLKDSLLQKIVLYYSKETKKGVENSRPRMEIIFSNWKTSPMYSSQAFSPEKYVGKKGDEYFLKPFYAVKYKLLDERVLTRTAKK